ncbi:hypothetical protein EMIT091MI3_80152 [Kosakonia quasisacchari]
MFTLHTKHGHTFMLKLYFKYMFKIMLLSGGLKAILSAI